VLLYGGAIALTLAVEAFGHSGSSAGYPSIAVYLAVLFYGLVTFFFLLETGAGRIAPPAENHALRKRRLGLILIFSGPVALGFGADQEVVFVNMLLVLPILVDTLCAPYRPLPSHRRPLLRFGRAGKIVAPLLLPGWPSGFLYTGLIFALSLLLLLFTGQLDSLQVITACVAGLGALLLPLALVLLVRPDAEKLGTIYIVIQLAMLICTMFAILVFELFDFDLHAVLSVSPLSTMIMALFDQVDGFWLAPVSVVTLGSVTIVAKRFLQLLRAGQPAAVTEIEPAPEQLS
jgi:hypothetical protein